jgi:RNA polymerase sigma factor (sigma-70 family)
MGKIMQEDAILVKQTLDGDEQAFHRLIMKYYAKIYALILSWVKNPEDAKDLTQEVFLEAYLDLGSLRNHEQFHIWLRQIARHQCQDWLRKEKTYIQLDENMVCETPSADEMLILRETLAKVMKAIDELPESESQLLKDRYLDDASYDDLEAKHGLSQSALAMRLLRAKQHVREKIKLLSGLWILSWHDVAKKIFVGGVEAMKITAKVKFITIGVGAVLILGGAGVILWHNQQPTQAIPESTVNQTAQKASVVSSAKSISSKKNISDEQIKKTKDNQNEDAQKTQAIAFLDSPEKDGQEKATVKGIGEEKKNADSERQIWGMSVEEAHKKGAELKVELNSWLNEAVALGDVILESANNAGKLLDPAAQKAEMELSNQASLRQIELIKKIALWEMRYTFWAEDPDALKPGGWIYELKMKIRPSGVIWSTPVE